jgi:hypothetical protein
MTFYKTQDGNLIKRKGGVSKQRIDNDPRFARTRENGEEFGNAAMSGKLVRDTVRSMMLNTADNTIFKLNLVQFFKLDFFVYFWTK